MCCRGYLYGLQFANGRSERGAFVCVVGGAVQRRLSDAERLSCDADPSTVQSLLRHRDKGSDVTWWWAESKALKGHMVNSVQTHTFQITFIDLFKVYTQLSDCDEQHFLQMFQTKSPQEVGQTLWTI